MIRTIDRPSVPVLDWYVMATDPDSRRRYVVDYTTEAAARRGADHLAKTGQVSISKPRRRA